MKAKPTSATGSDSDNPINPELIKERVNYLISLFKDNYLDIFPSEITGMSNFLRLIHMSFALDGLSSKKGFYDHVNEYKNDIDSAYFVTTLAEYFDNRTSDLILEPKLSLHSKRPDVMFKFNEQPIYIECKNPKKDILNGLEDEQSPMFDALYDVTHDYPCNITVAYSKPLATKELVNLNYLIKDKLKYVTGEGTIISNNDIEVSVTSVGSRSGFPGDGYFPLIVENRYSERNLLCFFTKNGITVTFVKKGISVIDNICSQLKKCSNKVPKNAPLVLAIQSEYLTGHPIKNSNQISSLFNPNKFTSINGILLCNWHYNNNTSNIISHKFVYINNPYARNPITDFERLFRDDASGVQYH